MAAKIERKHESVVIDDDYEIGLDRIPNHAALVEWIFICARKLGLPPRTYRG